MDGRRVDIVRFLANELKERSLKTATSLSCLFLITSLYTKVGVLTQVRKDNLIDAKQVVDINKLRDKTSLKAHRHLNLTLTIDTEPNTRGIHTNVLLRAAELSTDMPPPTNTLDTPPKSLTQAASPSTTTPAPAPTVPCRAIATSRALIGTFLHTQENFANIAAKADMADK
ncbi:hypothetical protein HAX54_027772 [Datura stramonium]|uniref:Uncharacterized protein n=1 Tax=Datura stramonium TaxID=4076 RepID=A0ABS8S8Y0_DATST|nr:hypothetical protein [Datura stramonium]